MKAADDQVTRRKGTKAIPLKKHSIAVRGRCARRATKPACCGLPGGGGHDTHRQLTRGGTRLQDSRGSPAPKGGKRSEARGRTRSRVGGARAVQVCCETSEVTKRPPGPRGAGARGHLPAHAGSRRTARLPFAFAWDCVGWVQLETRDPAGLVRSCASPRAGLDSQLLLPSLGATLQHPLGFLPGSGPPMPTPSGRAMAAGIQAEGFSDTG